MFQWQQNICAASIIFCIILFISDSDATLKLSKCKKALFDHKNGTFYSVGFPKPILPPQCFIYHFEASLEYFVEVEIETAEIPSSIGDFCVDFLRIYEEEKDGTIDDGSINYRELCGKSNLLENRNFISAFNHLFIVINVETSQSVRIKGSYHLLSKADYYIDALKTAPDICEYQVNALKGQLVSPQYPYYSPPNISCTYHFPSFRGHRLHLNITVLDLSKRTCSESQLSLYRLNPRRILERLCSSIDIPYTFSSIQELLLEFRTSSLKRQTRGFQLSFEYIPIKLQIQPSTNSTTTSQQQLSAETPSQLWSIILEKQGGGIDINGQQQSAVVSQCPVRIISSRASFPIYEESMTPSSNNSGVLSSEHFVPSEKVNFKCQFVFIGAPEEHVQITFRKFQLFAWKDKGVNSTSELRCEEMDHVSAHVLVGSRMSKIYDFCGSEIPPPLMSAKNILTLDYIVKSIGNGRHIDVEDDYGFVIEYRFLPDWGKQPPEVSKDPSKPCAYTFNGTVQTSGQFWSPNHPGFYPRNLDCEYVFFGKDTQIVVIHFEYFDIEGFGQCEDATHSDYVLFSNYKTIDRTNRRYCGSLRPNGDIPSESNYFRMAFRTNDIFDGTGFYAQYQFIDQRKIFLQTLL
uniref:CUB domain-containing protein n=1 Tax=Panagrolaimus sp. PS1159 TaxID=55785 RepID=A0AC35FRC4_9BILA